ncbi:MAG TPA: protocatechuate 3,4-dioxygenase subunit alpha [Acidimicrobiia bacterium]
MRVQGLTPSQTVGPYFSMRLAQPGENNLVGTETVGDRIRLEGRILDGDGRPIEDGLIELWQPNASGRFRHSSDDRGDFALDPHFTGFGRAMTDFATGVYRFDTIRPGRIPDLEGELQAPHLNLIVQARGMLRPSFTRVYFPDEAEANSHDLVLRTVPAHRRSTLIANLIDDSHMATFGFDIHFQGEAETVFFEYGAL